MEKQIDDLQQELEDLEAEMASEQVYSDFALMQEKCSRMEAVRQQMEDTLEALILLEEEMEG
jgi:ATP-binding cassette subfamily F protein 3